MGALLICRMLTKLILLLLAPDAFVIVSLPSVTLTRTVFSNHRLLLVGVPLIASVPSTLMRKTLSKNPASPAA
ncbi:MAG TPA: hypothetical protein PKB10_15390, partial [Tepidisphaeraceae bacterium]|nr:hypothetical protein [Tepidisphaeraceae bacterium]